MSPVDSHFRVEHQFQFDQSDAHDIPGKRETDRRDIRRSGWTNVAASEEGLAVSAAVFVSAPALKHSFADVSGHRQIKARDSSVEGERVSRSGSGRRATRKAAVDSGLNVSVSRRRSKPDSATRAAAESIPSAGVPILRRDPSTTSANLNSSSSRPTTVSAALISERRLDVNHGDDNQNYHENQQDDNDDFVAASVVHGDNAIRLKNRVHSENEDDGDVDGGGGGDRNVLERKAEEDREHRLLLGRMYAVEKRRKEKKKLEYIRQAQLVDEERKKLLLAKVQLEARGRVNDAPRTSSGVEADPRSLWRKSFQRSDFDQHNRPIPGNEEINDE